MPAPPSRSQQDRMAADRAAAAARSSVSNGFGGTQRTDRAPSAPSRGPASGNGGLGGGGRPSGGGLLGGTGNTNRGTTGTGGMNNLGRGGSGIGGNLGFGRDPAMGTRGGVAPGRTMNAPQYAGPARYDGPFNANRSQQTFGGYPNSMSGMMPGQTNGFAQPTNPMAPQSVTDPYGGMGKMGLLSGQTSPYNQPAQSITDPYGGMGKMGMRSGQTSPYNQPKAAPSQFTSNLGYQGDLNARAKAVSRGPGTISGVLPGSSPEAQMQTTNALSNALNDMGYNMTPGQLSEMARTSAAEAGGESALGQAAATNTMLNRMSFGLANNDQYGLMGDPTDMLAGYDANGIRHAMTNGKSGVPATSSYKASVPGTDAYRNAINSVAQAASPSSEFNATMPASVRNATHYFNPKVSNPTWGRSFNSLVGNHNFGNAEPTATQVAALRGTPPAASGPTMVAGINPAMAPPQAQTPSSNWFDGLPGVDAVKAAYQAVDENLVQPTKEQVAQYGGFERAGRLARTAVGIMNSLKSTGNPVRSGAGGDGRQDQGGQSNGSGPAPMTNPVTPPVQPPVNPMLAWMYPQYQSQWAGLPSGIGGYARG